MKVRPFYTVKGEEPVSKAFDLILGGSTSVGVYDGKKFIGVIDDRHVRLGIDPSKTKAHSVAVKCPVIEEEDGWKEVISKFLSGHFKALPYKEGNNIKGLITRSDVLEMLLEEGLLDGLELSYVYEPGIYSIPSTHTAELARKFMAEKKVHRLAVEEKGKVVGIISTIDLMAVKMKDQRREGKSLIKESKRVSDSKVVSEIMRPIFYLPVSISLKSAVKSMVENEVSSVLLTDKGRPIGILTATSIFKYLSKMQPKSLVVEVSGLDETNQYMKKKIIEEIDATIKPFASSLRISAVHVYVKHGKSLSAIAVRVISHSTKPLILKVEHYKLDAALRNACAELDSLLRKLKGRKTKRFERYEE
ncbi:MAG: CBS domain-containing protein [Candidatus Anstonellales archaeon]